MPDNENSTGKIKQKFYALSSKYRNRGLLESRYKLKSSKSANAEVDQEELDEYDNIVDNDQVEDYHWLKRNVTPEQMVLDKWKRTFSLRREHYKNNQNLLEDWPILIQKLGSTLVWKFTSIYLKSKFVMKFKVKTKIKSKKLHSDRKISS